MNGPKDARTSGDVMAYWSRRFAASATTTTLDSRPADMENIDLSNFDANAILRGAQLTLVGGMFGPTCCFLQSQRHANMCLQ